MQPSLNERMRKGETTVKEIRELLANFRDDARVSVSRNTAFVIQDDVVHGLDEIPKPTKQTHSDGDTD